MSESDIDLNLAVADSFLRAGQYKEAAAICLQIIKQSPHNGFALHRLGLIARDTNRPDLAVNFLRQASRRQPNNADLQNDLGVVLGLTGENEAAVQAFALAARLRPDSADFLENHARALAMMLRVAEAIPVFRSAVEKSPDSARLRLELAEGLIIQRDGGFESEALEHARKALELEPHSVNAHGFLGMVLFLDGRPSESMKHLQRVLETRPDDPITSAYLAHAHLQMGDYSKGWAAYEHRLRVAKYSLPPCPLPAWDGKIQPGKTLLLEAEQGYGDVFHYIRYASILAKAGMRVVVSCSRAAAPLVPFIDGISELVSFSPPFGNADFYVPLMSLPYFMKTTVETIPNDVPYIRADPVKIEEYRRQLPAGKKVGLVWAGNPKHEDDKRRSCPPEYFAPLAQAAAKGVKYISLQLRTEGKFLPASLSAIDFGPGLESFADTAGILANLDLLISVDTSIVHLAGAMARPVWTLLPKVADYRWLLDRDDTPWYPTMRLFRQTTHRDWKGVMDRVTNELLDFIRAFSTHSAGDVH